MNKNSLLIIGAVILLLVLVGGYFVFVNPANQTIGQKSFGMFLTVGDRVGFNIDSNAVYFGKTLPGSMAKRDLIVSNDFEERVLVIVETTGDFSKWVSWSESNFYLNPNDVKNITLTASVPNNAQLGDYFGSVTVYFVKAQN